METERDHCAEVEERADSVQHAELGIQCLHLCRNLLNTSVKLTRREQVLWLPRVHCILCLLPL